MPNIIGKHLNNKMENSNERLLTEQCACDLTSKFPCSDIEFSSRKRTYFSVNKVAINLYLICILYKQIKPKSVSKVLSPRL